MQKCSRGKKFTQKFVPPDLLDCWGRVYLHISPSP